MTFAKSSFYRGKLEESASDPRKLLSIFSSPPPPSSLTPEDYAVLQLLESSHLTTFPLDPIHTAPVSLPGPATLHLMNGSLSSGHVVTQPHERLQTAGSADLSSVLILLDLSAGFDRVNHKILLSVLTDLGITATAWNPSKTELLFVPSTASEDVGGLGRHMSWLPEGVMSSHWLSEQLSPWQSSYAD
ncbi:hypothetical protein NFI96_018118 [Prochilodus magdalenae]|nr:hypothetical protein NFI96_018118 [Prochilodus magdalenae]